MNSSYFKVFVVHLLFGVLFSGQQSCQFALYIDTFIVTSLTIDKVVSLTIDNVINFTIDTIINVISFTMWGGC